VIGLDTNILVRYITQDDPSQSKRAVRILESKTPVERPKFFVNLIIMVEVLWVLQRTYRFKRAEQIEVIERLISNPQIHLESPRIARRALHFFQDHSADFSDCLLAAINESEGCETTYTFDKKAAKLPGMNLA